MDQVREVCSSGSSLRKAKKLRVRLPLPKLTVAVDDPVAIAAVRRSDRRRAQRQGRRTDRRHRQLWPFRADRQRPRRRTPDRQGRAGGDQGGQGGGGRAQPRRHPDRRPGSAAARRSTARNWLPPSHGRRSAAESTRKHVTAALPDGAGLVVLDVAVTPELEAEGWAKDRIRELQDLRKSSGLDVSDRISVVDGGARRTGGLGAYPCGLIAGEILATSFEFVDSGRCPTAPSIGDGVTGADRQGLSRARARSADPRACWPPNVTASPARNCRPRRVSTSPLPGPARRR